MRAVYTTAGILVQEGPRESLQIVPEGGSARLDFRVGKCRAGEVTAEQHTLFEHREHAGGEDIVIYLVRAIIPPMNGCAASPPGRPGAIVASEASRLTLAHEVGHVLGLAHVRDPQNLMTDRGTATIRGQPVLTDAQMTAMHASPYCL